ncbi:MAG: HAD hydrolase-like protein [Halalkalicoccus sp.]
MSYDAIVFDMDGVLIEGWGTDPAVYAAAAERALSELGADASTDRIETLGAPAYSPAMAGCCRALGIDPEAFWTRRERVASRLSNERIDRGLRPAYEDVSTLSELADRCAIGVASNNRQATVAFVVDLLDLPVSAYRGRDPTTAGYRRRKPDSYYIECVLSALTAEAGADAADVEALYVGDRETDVEAAEDAGIDSAYLRRSHNRERTLSLDPTYELSGLDELLDVV